MVKVMKRQENLYSVWRNSDDALIILDGNARECSEALGLKSKEAFYHMLTTNNKRDRYTIVKITAQEALAQGAE